MQERWLMRLMIAVMIAEAAWVSLSLGDTFLSEDIVGIGSLWVSSDHLSVQDRAGGIGSWSYGHILSPGSLQSFYSFDGNGGWYSEGSTDYQNQSQWIRVSDATSLNASSLLEANETTISIAGEGMAQGWVKNYGQNGHSTDGSRVYLSGTFEINRNTRAW